MRIYITGPMTGLTAFNYPAFHEAKAALIGAGHDVISPADLPIRDDWEWIDYLLVDIDSLFAVDGVATLDGYETSKGARIECRIAERRGIPVLPLSVYLSASLQALIP